MKRSTILGRSCRCDLALRFIFLFVNIFVLIIAMAMLGYGIFEIIRAEEGDNTLESTVVMILGLIVLFVEVLAIFGALTENRHYLYAFAGILVILAVGLIIAGIIYLTFKMGKKVAKQHAKDLFEKVENGDVDARLQVELVQKALSCCGWDGPEFWTRLGLTSQSCCKGSLLDESFWACTDTFDEGCEGVKIDVNIGLGVCTLVFGFILVVAFVVTLFLAMEMKREERMTLAALGLDYEEHRLR